MQKNPFFWALALIVCTTQGACTNSSTGTIFSSKQDSVQFARAVYNLYESDVSDFQTDTNRLPDGKGVHPITWDTVQAYQDFYDKKPALFDLQNQPYKGFSVDAKGYSWILQNRGIKGLYLRLGRKGDGSYTIMLLGTDSAGNILQGKSLRSATNSSTEPSNFDNTIPCPDDCPVDPD